MLEYNYTDETYHHGILGMHWGIRRYQNKDGTLTEEGRRRLGYYKEKRQSKLDNRTAALLSFANNEKVRAAINKTYDKQTKNISNMTYKQMVTEKAATTAIKVGATVATNMLATAAINKMAVASLDAIAKNLDIDIVKIGNAQMIYGDPSTVNEYMRSSANVETSRKIARGAAAVSSLLLPQTVDEKIRTSIRNRESRKNDEKEELALRRSMQ